MPNQTITFDDLMTQTAMTYPETYARDIKGRNKTNFRRCC